MRWWNETRPDTIDVQEWLTRTFPHRQRWIDHVVHETDNRPPTITPVAYDVTATLGTAFEHAVVFDLATHLPYAHLFDALPPAYADTIASLAGFHDPSTRKVPYGQWVKTNNAICADVSTTALHSAASRLARAKDLVYNSGDGTAAGRVQLAGSRVLQVQSSGDTLAGALNPLWRTHLHHTRDTMHSLGPVVAADVPLRDGRRVADLIAGTTLVEIKTGQVDPTDLLNQILTYLLLTVATAEHPITEVAVLLARHGLVLRYPAQDLADELAGHPVDLPGLAGTLAAIIDTCRPPGKGRWAATARTPESSGAV